MKRPGRFRYESEAAGRFAVFAWPPDETVGLFAFFDPIGQIQRRHYCAGNLKHKAG
jgi:hypothetical protein